MKRLNQALEKEIYNDGSSMRKNGGGCDRKISVDISPDRVETISKKDPHAVREDVLQSPLNFYDEYQKVVETRLLPAITDIIGTSIQDDISFNYRMIEYYPSSSTTTTATPRLAEHRDFGYITLIQASSPGLQVQLNNRKWYDVPSIDPGSAILMGGWCAKLRSNNRIPAILHRVPKHLTYEKESRISAVLFVMPKHTTTPLDPIIRVTETQQFINGVTASSLQKHLVESKSEKSIDKWLEAVPRRKKDGSARFWSSSKNPFSTNLKKQQGGGSSNCKLQVA
jgi:hypothetical protein